MKIVYDGTKIVGVNPSEWTVWALSNGEHVYYFRKDECENFFRRHYLAKNQGERISFLKDIVREYPEEIFRFAIASLRYFSDQDVIDVIQDRRTGKKLQEKIRRIWQTSNFS